VQYAATFRQRLRDGGHGMVASCPAGGRPVPDYDDGTQPDPDYGVAPLAYDANARRAAAIR
jgi:hypothetical protein